MCTARAARPPQRHAGHATAGFTPHSMSDLDMLAWVTGRSIRNKELRVPLSDED